MRFVDQIGGRAQGLARRGNLLALATDAHVTLYDVSEPRAPAYLGVCEPVAYDPNMDHITGVALGDGCAVLIFGFDTCLLDVTDPRRPTVIPRTDDLRGGGFGSSTAIGAGVVYIGADEGVLVYDVGGGKMTAPEWGRAYGQVPRGNVSVGGASLAVDGDLLYVLHLGKLHVLALNGAQSPSHLASCPVPVPSWNKLIAADAGRLALSVDDGLAVIDCREPARPRVAATLRLSGPAHALAVVGNHVYAAVEEGGGMYVIDVAYADRPHILAHLGGLGHTEGLVTTPTHVFLLDRDANARRHYKRISDFSVEAPQPLRLVDVRDPARPEPIPLTTSFQHAAALAVAGDTLYVVDHHNAFAGLRAVPLADPGATHGWAPLLEPGRAVRARGTMAVVATRSGLQTFDVADRQQPRKLGELAVGRVRAMDVDEADQRAYLLTRNHLHVISLAQPKRAREVDLISIGQPCRAVVAAGRYVHVAAGGSVWSIRVGKGHATSIQRSMRLGRIRQLVHAGDWLYAATREGIYELYTGGEGRIGQPDHPTWKAEYELPSYALATVGERHLFHIRYNEMLLLDVTEHGKARVVDHWDTLEQKWWVSDAVAVGNRIYVAAENLGVLVLECNPPSAAFPV